MDRNLIESDSSLAVGWVNRKEHIPWKLFSILDCIDRLVVEVNCVGIRHIIREGNGMANCLEKRGRDRVIDSIVGLLFMIQKLFCWFLHFGLHFTFVTEELVTYASCFCDIDVFALFRVLGVCRFCLDRSFGFLQIVLLFIFVTEKLVICDLCSALLMWLIYSGCWECAFLLGQKFCFGILFCFLHS